MPQYSSSSLAAAVLLRTSNLAGFTGSIRTKAH